jgi:hypothetical protein
MLEPSPLDERKQQILKAVVSDYTVTGVPVGSQVLAAKYFIALSSATWQTSSAPATCSSHIPRLGGSRPTAATATSWIS